MTAPGRLHSLLAAWLRHRGELRRSRDGESGTSLIEMMMAMLIMTICGGLFTGAVITLNRSAGLAQSVTTSATQTNQAFLVLDRTVRYAAVVTTPGRSTGTGATTDWYVELRDTTSGSEQCIQLRVDIATEQLQRRAWDPADMSTLTAFKQISPGITNGAASAGSADQPFVLPATSSSANHQKLTVTLLSTAGPPVSDATTRSSFTLSALNSSLPVPSGSICQQAGRP